MTSPNGGNQGAPERRLFVTIILDGVGVGAQPDSVQYGDEDANTLGHVCAARQPRLPNLQAAGLGLVVPLMAVAPAEAPQASWGKMREFSAGKDSTTGHWELAGLRLSEPFPTYPEGFPQDLVDAFLVETGASGILGNEVASGTEIVSRLGGQHVESGLPILYTSADSVFQVAAHVDVVPLETLYAWCETARTRVCVGRHGAGRVIARPFAGAAGGFYRLSDRRRDYARPPAEPTLQGRLQQAGVRTVSIGKVADLFAGVGFDETNPTGRNAVGIRSVLEWLRTWDGKSSFVWVNLIDFDQEYGHRNDPAGFATSLEEFDRFLPAILGVLPHEAELVITADHGNDPTTSGTDHSREHVPVLYFSGREPSSLGVRESFNDHAATVARYFGLETGVRGSPF